MMCAFIAIVIIGFYIWTLLIFFWYFLFAPAQILQKILPYMQDGSILEASGFCATVQRDGPFLCHFGSPKVQITKAALLWSLYYLPLLWLLNRDGFSEFFIMVPKCVWLSCWKRCAPAQRIKWVSALSSASGESPYSFLSVTSYSYTQKLSTPESKVLWQVGGREPLVTYDRTKVHDSCWHPLLSCYLLRSFFFFRVLKMLQRVTTISTVFPLLLLRLWVVQLSHITATATEWGMQCCRGVVCWHETRRHANNRQSLSCTAEGMCCWKYIGVTVEWHWAWRPTNMC